MFKRNKTRVYELAKSFNQEVFRFVNSHGSIDPNYANQLIRSSLSIVCNLAEGSGRLTSRDRRNFFVISRGSLFETLAIIDVLHDLRIIQTEEYEKLLSASHQISKLLYSLIKNLEGNSRDTF